MIAVDRPGLSAVKTLFALSCNTCAYPGCEERLTDPSWKQVKADVAHISGEKHDAPRYDASMTDDARQGFDNLLLLCRNHHRLIDRLEPDAHPVERLRGIKARHEERCREARWADEPALESYARLAIGVSPTSVEDAGTPRLRVQKSDGDAVQVVNVGDGDAYDIRIQPIDDSSDQAWVSVEVRLGACRQAARGAPVPTHQHSATPGHTSSRSCGAAGMGGNTTQSFRWSSAPRLRNAESLSWISAVSRFSAQ